MSFLETLVEAVAVPLVECVPVPAPKSGDDDWFPRYCIKPLSEFELLYGDPALYRFYVGEWKGEPHVAVVVFYLEMCDCFLKLIFVY